MFLAGDYSMRSFCDMNPSVSQPLVHGAEYVIPFEFTIFSILPPLIHGTEYVLFVI